MLREEIDRDNLGEILRAVSGKKGTALSELVSQIEGLVIEPSKPDSRPDDPNPFLALFGWEDRKPDNARKNGNDTTHLPWWSVGKDTDVEAVIRSQAILEARRRCLEFYGRCKVALRMARF